MQYSQNVDYFILGLLLKMHSFPLSEKTSDRIQSPIQQVCFSLKDSFKVKTFFREEIDMKTLISQRGKSEA